MGAGPASPSLSLLTRLPALEGLEMPGSSLPTCLSQIKTLRVLTLAGGACKGSIADVEKALQPLTQLTQLVLRHVHSIPQALAGLGSLKRVGIAISNVAEPVVDHQLPGGPWLANLRQLAAPAQLVADSPQLLAGASALQELSLFSFFGAQVTVQSRILSWAAQHPTLRCLSLDSLGEHCSEASFRAVSQAMAANPALSFSFGRLSTSEFWPEPPLFEPWQMH